MKIIPATCEEQLKFACEIYEAMNDNSFIKVDLDVCYANIIQHWKRLGYVRLIVDDNTVVGFIMAVQAPSKHSKDKILLQEYFCTNLKGFKAYRAVKMAHNDMINYAKRCKADVVMSCGSHNDPEHNFAKMLERSGWSRKGHVALKRLDRATPGAQVGCPGCASPRLRPVRPASLASPQGQELAAQRAARKDGSFDLGDVLEFVGSILD